MSDLQLTSSAFAILLVGCFVSFFGMRMIRPALSRRRLFWWASALPPFFLTILILIQDHMRDATDDLDNPFAFFGTGFDVTTFLFSLLIFGVLWMASAGIIALLQLRLRHE